MKIKLLSIMLLAALIVACSDHKTKNNDLLAMGIKGKVKSITESSYVAVKTGALVSKGEKGEKDFPWTDTRYLFNTDGNFLEHSSFNSKGTLIFQQLFKYDPKGIKSEQTYYYKFNTDSLRERSVYKYDNSGKLTDLKTYDLIGYLDQRFTYKYDQDGNRIETISYDSHNDIDSTSVSTFDSKGNCITTIARNADSSLKYKTTSTWDEKGNKLEYNLFNPDGSLYTKTVCKYDSKGNKTEYSKYIDNKLFEKQTFKYDKNGFLTEQEIFKTDGRMATKLTFIYESDDKKNWIKRTELNFNIPQFITERRIEYNE